MDALHSVCVDALQITLMCEGLPPFTQSSAYLLLAAVYTRTRVKNQFALFQKHQNHSAEEYNA